MREQRPGRAAALGDGRSYHGRKTMTHVFRISKGPVVGDILASVESCEAFARDHGPGRYHVDEHSLNPFPGRKVSARSWGTVIHQSNGRIALKPYFYGDHYAVKLPIISNV